VAAVLIFPIDAIPSWEVVPVGLPGNSGVDCTGGFEETSKFGEEKWAGSITFSLAFRSLFSQLTFFFVVLAYWWGHL
jgi:hypothetical protein